jgi:uncharacterized protein (TIGR02001 family)
MKLIKLSLAAAVLVTGIYAADSEIGVSANVAMTSNYVWRGMTQTDDSPAVQGGFDLDWKGLYVGVWGSNVEYGTASLEADIYLGYSNEIVGITYDIGFIEYMYPNQMDELNFGEAYVGLGYDFGVASIGAKYSLGVDTHDTDAASDWEPENAWEVTASAPLPMEFSVDAVYGDYDTLGAYYLVGLNKSFGKFDFTLAYTANDGNGVSSAEQDNFVATMATSF